MKTRYSIKVQRWVKVLPFFLFTFLPLAAQQLSDKYTKDRPVVIVCDWDKAPYELQ